MFFVKSKINENAELRITLDYNNVFTICPMCNKEHAVDITEIFMEEEADFDCVVYCADCSREREKKRQNDKSA